MFFLTYPLMGDPAILWTRNQHRRRDPFACSLLVRPFSGQSDDGGPGMCGQTEAQCLKLIQERSNCRYESGPFGVEQQAKRARQTEAESFGHRAGEGVIEYYKGLA